MARELEDLEFWLPSEFLTDDDLLSDFKTTTSDYFFGSAFGFGSDLSSPVESVTGTTETESDEDDFITELSRRVAQTTFQESGLSPGYTAKNLKLSGSPQSTLCGFKSGSRGFQSNNTRVYSPPAVNRDAPSWDTLYAAAAEVANMRMTEETTAFNSQKLFARPPKHTPQQKLNPAIRFPQKQTQTQAQFSYQQLQAAKFQQMTQQQILKNGAWEQGMIEFQLQNARRNNNNNNNGAGRAQALSMAAWPTLQQSQQKPAMRAVFLPETGAKKERIGTGVFMPRRFNTTSNPTTETRKKPAAATGCPTVLIPERVVQALNLNLDSIDAKIQSRGHGNLSNQYGDYSVNEELRLPQEWTY